MAENPPYTLQVGTFTKLLDKIKTAATPERFTQDSLASKLGMRGGTANSMIPLLKKAGFLSSDGTPTETYRRFRNPSQSGRAAADALRHGYKTLFEMNESAHELDDKELRGLVVQATGLEQNARVVHAITGTFKALKKYAQLGGEEESSREEKSSQEVSGNGADEAHKTGAERAIGMNLSYTINLNLPATADVKVFDAIFRSLREHLLKK
jgi:hypothetical protein